MYKHFFDTFSVNSVMLSRYRKQYIHPLLTVVWVEEALAVLLKRCLVDRGIILP